MRIYPDKTVDEEFKDLGDLGYTGSLNDRQFAFLTAQGLFGALADKFSQWSGEEASGTLTIDTLTYLRGTAGVAPTLTSEVTPTGTTSANYITTGVFAATAQTKAQIDASPNKFTITKGTITFSGEPVEIDNSVTAGVVSAYMQDSSAPAIVSNVATDSPVTYDSEAPTFSSAEVGTVDATSLIVTFNKALYGSTSAADWDVQVNASPATESAAVISGSTVDITLGAAVSNGDTVTVAYTGTGLVGVDAEVVATFTAQSVTNNVAAGYTETYVDNQDAAYFTSTFAAGGFANNGSRLNFAIRFKPQETGTGGRFLKCSGRTDIYTGGTSISLLVKDTANTVVSGLNTFTSVLSLDTEHFLEVVIDLGDGTNSTVEAHLDGVSLGTITTNTNNGLIELKTGVGLLADNTGANIVDFEVSELFVSTGAMTIGTLWNGGVKANLATLAGHTPAVYFGNGQTATDWNNNTNQGTATMTVNGTFAAVV